MNYVTISINLKLTISDKVFINVFIFPVDKKDEAEGESESEESEWPDYFAGINFEKKVSAVQVPPQNYIKPKNRQFFKNKGGSRSFMKGKPKPKGEKADDFNIELI